MVKKAKTLKVKARNPSLRGQRVAGVAKGRVYWVDPRTNLLHLLDGGVPAPKPGCHLDDVEEFRGFPSTYEVEKRPPPPPPKKKGKKTPPPPPPSASGGSEDPGKPDSSSGEAGSSGASDPTLSAAEVRAAELAAMSKAKLVAVAKELEIKGRTTMDESELISAIQVAESN